jgi:hypothetical protein
MVVVPVVDPTTAAPGVVIEIVEMPDVAVAPDHTAVILVMGGGRTVMVIMVAIGGSTRRQDQGHGESHYLRDVSTGLHAVYLQCVTGAHVLHGI